jgi:hypothetical protein
MNRASVRRAMEGVYILDVLVRLINEEAGCCPVSFNCFFQSIFLFGGRIVEVVCLVDLIVYCCTL